jgi:hypothetical protein
MAQKVHFCPAAQIKKIYNTIAKNSVQEKQSFNNDVATVY